MLFIWVEGPDDRRFFEAVVKPLFLRKFAFVEVREYAEMNRKAVNNFLRAIPKMGAAYIWASDKDVPGCIRDKKHEVVSKFGLLSEESVLIVAHEIESWYAAGLGEQSAARLKVPIAEDTDNLSKEGFDRLIPKTYDSRVDFMNEVLNCYSLDIAQGKNTSLRYLLRKYALL